MTAAREVDAKGPDYPSFCPSCGLYNGAHSWGCPTNTEKEEA